MWWRNTVPKHLPIPQGPYVPGCLDIMSGFSPDSTFIRVYYPSSIKKQEVTKSSWYKWLPQHSQKYLDGFALFSNIGSKTMKLVLWYYGGVPLVPAAWEAPLMETKTKFPLIVFSHGFGGTRFISATVGAELASHGYVFASVEHRETSAAATYFYESPEKLKNNEPTWIPHEKMEFGPNHYAIRNKQLHKRKEEIKKLVDFLDSINLGSADNILQSNFDLTSFKGLLDMNSICMMGHSFGGAASLLALANDERLKFGVILDGWMFPLKGEEIVIDKPLLFINTQTFHIESNLAAMEKIFNEPKQAVREVYTIRHTTHETQTDLPHIIGYWYNWFMYKLDPVVGTNINNHLILRFFHKVSGIPSDIEESENYLTDKDDDIVQGTFNYFNTKERGFSVWRQIRSNKL